MNYLSDRYIPDDGPQDAKILLVGEAPGADEYLERKPFVGESGALLITALNRAGVSRSEVRLANLFHYRPDKNNFKGILGEKALVDGLKELYAYIETHRPNVIAALGAYPLQFLTGKKGIMKWRGSILSYINDPTIKVIPTIHPAAVLRDHGLYPTFDQDIKRIIADSEFADKRLPVRKFIINPNGLEGEEWTQRLSQADFLGTDIETIKNSRQILCVGFAPDPTTAVCFISSNPESRRSIERILASDADKIFQLGTFDTIQLKLNGYEINNGRKARSLGRSYFWDTLLAQHILAPELPRSLEYLTSIYTREPYYKTVGRGSIPDDEKGWSDKVEKQSLYEYNCRDCCCTIEIAIEQMKEIEASGLSELFNYEMQMLEVTDHISNAGMLVDNARRKLIEDTILTKWRKKQFIVDALVGSPVNVRSPKLKDILYGKFNLPVRKNRMGGITTDEDAIVSLITYCKDHISGLKTDKSKLEWQVKLGVCQTILEIRGLRQLLSNYILETSNKGKIRRVNDDGRVRSTYKQNTETGRWSASKFVDGSGFNSQTLPRDPIEVPDEIQIDPKLVSQLDQEEEEDGTITDEES
jgi:uracil-DNA glycosylase family 4